MTAPLIRKRQQIAIKQEAAGGTAEALTASEVVLHTGVAEFEPDVELTPRDAMTGSLSPRGTVVGATSARLRFKMFLRGTSGAPVASSNEPDFSVPFQGCGVLPTVSGVGPNEQTSFVPNTAHVVDDSSGVYCTVALYQDGKQYLIYGAVGNCKLTFTVGSPVLAEFEFQGVYQAPTDVALLVPTYTTIVEPAFMDAALSVLSYAAPPIKTLSFDFGNQIVMRPNPGNTSGFFTGQIVDRTPAGSIDVEEELAATKNWWTEWSAGTSGSITTGVFPSGGSNYNQFQLNIPNARYKRVSLGDRDGIATAPLEFDCNANSDAGDDEWELIQT